jgi:MFS family permease
MTFRSVAAFRGWRAFGHRNYRLFYGGQLISLIGTWMQTVAQGWLVLQLTGDPWMLGLVAAAQFLPVLVLGLFGGLIADGLPKRRTLVATQASAMTLAFVLAGLAATHSATVGLILVLAFLLGCTNVVDMPTRQAFVVEMVGRADIGNAVALNSAMFNAARVLGPAVAGLAIGTFGVAFAFFLNGLSFLAVIAGLLLMRAVDLHPAPRLARPTTLHAVGRDLAEGLRYVRRTPIVLLAMFVVGIASTFGMNFNVLVPPLARDVLASDATGFGFLMAASGVGSLVAALGIAFTGRTSPWIIAIGALVMGVAEMGIGLSRSFPVSMVGMFLAGGGAIAMAAMANTTIQLTVPDALRGRVMSVYLTVFAGSTPFGGLAMGAIAAGAGPAFAMGLGGAISAVGAVVGLVWVARLGLGRRALAQLPGERGPFRSSTRNAAVDVDQVADTSALDATTSLVSPDTRKRPANAG